MALALGDVRKHGAEQLFDRAIELARLTDNPYFLCEYLHHRARLLRRWERRDESQASNDEALQIATRVERRDVQLPAELLAVRLRAERGELDARTARDALLACRENWPAAGEAEQAAIAYELWRVTGEEATGIEATEIYRRLYAHGQNVKYRRRVERVTGERLPPSTPLQPLVTDPAEREVRIPEILARADELIGELLEGRVAA
jgi:hypothetical protein